MNTVDALVFSSSCLAAFLLGGFVGTVSERDKHKTDHVACSYPDGMVCQASDGSYEATVIRTNGNMYVTLKRVEVKP